MNTSEEKKRLIKKHSPKSPILKNCFFAYLVGGLICGIGQILLNLYLSFGLSDKVALPLVTVTLIGAAATLTALGLFDRVARFSGAGTLVPVTGFSNAVTSQAVDSGSEGYILGVGAKIFTIAGPVIVYGLLSGVLYGIVYFLVDLFI